MVSLKENKRIFPLVGAIIVFVLSFSVLYLGNNIGLSDNGDFRRVLLVNNMEYENEDNYYYLFKQDYKMKVEGDTFWEKVSYLCESNNEEEIYSSPHFIIIKASKVMNFIVNSILVRDETHYDIWYLAFIYILMLSMAAWGIFTFFADEARKLRLAVFVIFIVMFCDAGYLLYFNSLYGEPLQYVSLMMLIALGLLIYKRPTIPKIVCFFVSLYFFAGSKLANVPYSVIVSLLALSFAFLRRDRRYRIGIAVSVALAAVCIANLYLSIPAWMHNDTTYQSVFFGAVKESETPEKDLKQLGIDEKYLPLVNTHAYMDEGEYPIDITTPEFEHDFYDKVSKMDVAFFYLRHPVRFVHKIAFSIENSSSLRPLNSGNSDTVIMDYSNRYSIWSNLRVASRFLYKPIIVFLMALIMTIYVVLVHIYLVRSKKQTDEKRLYLIMAMYVLIVGLWINMCLPIIGNGEADIMKHMFLFTNFMDVLFAAIIIGIVNMHTRNKIISLSALAIVMVALQIEPPKETVEFGTYNGKPIKWEVMKKYEDGSEELVTRFCVTERIFDDENNMWETSDLREWLNSDFINEFTMDELARIVPQRNEVMLTYNDRGLAESGNHTHFWSATRNEVADLSETAYKYYVDDMVYIPTLDMMKDIDVNGSYWILCPYGYNDKMQRYMKNDGFILHTNVDNIYGVRAAVRVK
ncbi:MAG: DUF6273 domain-containing protein [Clostridia bacterium]|nr:DUF6273 domain-containing protein [Clostridia bacterium]